MIIYIPPNIPKMTPYYHHSLTGFSGTGYSTIDGIFGILIALMVLALLILVIKEIFEAFKTFTFRESWEWAYLVAGVLIAFCLLFIFFFSICIIIASWM